MRVARRFASDSIVKQPLHQQPTLRWPCSLRRGSRRLPLRLPESSGSGAPGGATVVFVRAFIGERTAPSGAPRGFSVRGAVLPGARYDRPPLVGGTASGRLSPAFTGTASSPLKGRGP